MTMSLSLAAASPGAWGEALPAMGLLVALVAIGACLLWRVRRTLRGRHQTGIPFTLAELRALRDRGDLSQEEYERTHKSMVDAVREDSEQDAKDR